MASAAGQGVDGGEVTRVLLKDALVRLGCKSMLGEHVFVELRDLEEVRDGARAGRAVERILVKLNELFGSVDV